MGESSGCRHPEEDSYSGHFLRTLSTFALAAERGFAIPLSLTVEETGGAFTIPCGSEAKFRDKAVPVSINLLRPSHTLRASFPHIFF